MRPYFEIVNGVKIPRVGFGVYKIKQDQNFDKTIIEAIQAGYRHFDTARIYGNEEALGNVIRNSGIAREEFFLTSKVWTTDLGYEETLRAFEKSCRKLNTSYLDMYLIHFAGPRFIESWKAIEKLYTEGKIKVIGTANFEIEHFEQLKKQTKIMPMINQIETHPGFQQQKLREYMSQHQILHEAWGPLGQGNKSLLENETLQKIANRHQKTVGQIILRWHLHRDTIVIPKSSNPRRIKENIDVFVFSLSEEEMGQIAALDSGKRYAVNPKGFQINPIYVGLTKLFLK
ncbi:aldo/keto reductase [Paenibacillus radicis (ex Gao et al. 2016)]|uniref:Glyoxal reductase n=1 Tax=Paenibacillus radicis (ex Gao et al. 2016) TaxID=1737354 RepID=A0A917M104_9BACL|nr:aldo/keto reductase [Paenibacillus radicis (ex Gao et al. 2016)]GGG69704.1 glyoxal reductase [Paenibacillus radicis (ex Gao et al. 2016)]